MQTTNYLPSPHPIYLIFACAMVGTLIPQLGLVALAIVICTLSTCVFFLSVWVFHSRWPGTITFLSIATLIWCFGYKQRTEHVFDLFHQAHTEISIKGTIADITLSQNQSRMRQCITVTMQKIGREKQSLLFAPKIMVYIEPSEQWCVGDYVHILRVKITKPHNSFSKYLMKEGVITTAFIRSSQITLINRPDWCIARSIHRTKNTVLNTVKQQLSDKSYALYSSLFLGNRQSCRTTLDPIALDFKFWGILHHLARSGLHMAVFITLWAKLLILLPIRYTFKQLLLLIIGSLYWIFSWSSTSFLRAVSSFYIYRTCLVSRKPADQRYILVLVCLLYLLCNPLQLYFLDFQLTFSMTYLLLWATTTFK